MWVILLPLPLEPNLSRACDECLLVQVEDEVPLLMQKGAAITFFAPSDEAVQSFDRALNKAGAKLTAAQSKWGGPRLPMSAP